MKELFDFSVFADEGVSEPARWFSKTTNEDSDIRVIFRNDSFLEEAQWEATDPTVDIHVNQGDVKQGDRLTIDSIEYEVRDITPADSEGFRVARLIKETGNAFQF